MNAQSYQRSQLSLMPMFGVIGHPEADKYNAALDLWAENFGIYATLERFTPQITRTSQSFEQLELLINAVTNEQKVKELLSIDTEFCGLNTALKNFVSRAQMSAFERSFRVDSNRVLAERAAREAQAAATLARQNELLRQLELKEKLLAHESAFKSEKAAISSSLIKQATALSDIKPVVTEKKIWIWDRNVAAFDRVFEKVIFDKSGKSDQGYFICSYVLTFEEVAA